MARILATYVLRVEEGDQEVRERGRWAGNPSLQDYHFLKAGTQEGAKRGFILAGLVVCSSPPPR